MHLKWPVGPLYKFNVLGLKVSQASIPKDTRKTLPGGKHSAISVLELQCSFQLHVELDVREGVKKEKQKGRKNAKIG